MAYNGHETLAMLMEQNQKQNCESTKTLLTQNYLKDWNFLEINVWKYGGPSNAKIIDI